MYAPFAFNFQAPTLVLHRVDDSPSRWSADATSAEHIPGAKYIELPGDDHLLQAFERDLLDRVLDEIEEFITGVGTRPEPDRVLATVMFTDIGRSTERAAQTG